MLSPNKTLHLTALPPLLCRSVKPTLTGSARRSAIASSVSCLPMLPSLHTGGHWRAVCTRANTHTVLRSILYTSR